MKPKPILKNWEVTLAVVMSMKDITDSVWFNQKQVDLWLLSDAVNNIMVLYVNIISTIDIQWLVAQCTKIVWDQGKIEEL